MEKAMNESRGAAPLPACMESGEQRLVALHPLSCLFTREALDLNEYS